jgi:Arc/MetJ family transcription regulator
VYKDSGGMMKLTNIEIDENLIKECIKTTGIKTRKSLIDHALRELLRHENQFRILELKGKIEWEGNLDEWRKGRTA